jgi:hypothetical protein
VIRILAQDAIRLRLCQRQGTGDLTHAAHVVALIEIEWREQLIGGNCHRRKELNAVSFALAGQQHHAIVEAIGAFLWRKIGDVRRAHARWSDTAIIETRLGKGILRSVECAAAPGVEPASRRHCEQGEERNCRHDPRQRIRSPR